MAANRLAAPPPQPHTGSAPPDTPTTGTAPGALAARITPQHRERGSLVFDGIPLPDPALAAVLERYEQSRGATFLDSQADGSLLVLTRFGESEQVHRVAAPLGIGHPITGRENPG